MLFYRARMKTEGVKKAYLEMWVHLPGKGKFFSRGIRDIAKGTTDWKNREILFYLKKGQRPDKVELNLATKGAGTVWLEDIELSMGGL